MVTFKWARKGDTRLCDIPLSAGQAQGTCSEIRKTGVADHKLVLLRVDQGNGIWCAVARTEAMPSDVYSPKTGVGKSAANGKSRYPRGKKKNKTKTATNAYFEGGNRIIQCT